MSEVRHVNITYLNLKYVHKTDPSTAHHGLIIPPPSFLHIFPFLDFLLPSLSVFSFCPLSSGGGGDARIPRYL